MTRGVKGALGKDGGPKEYKELQAEGEDDQRRTGGYGHNVKNAVFIICS